MTTSTPVRAVEQAAGSVEARGRTRRSTSQSSSSPIVGLLPLALALAAWQLLGREQSPYFPPPSRWFDALLPLWTSGALMEAVRATIWTLLLGLVLATAVGGLLGMAVGSSRRADQALGPLFEFLRVLPAAALVPLAALVLGYTLQMKLAVVVLPATWPILLACRSARRAVSPVLIDASRSLGLSRGERFRKVLVPSLTPGILLGLRVAAPLALIITILVEIVTRVDGVGALLGAAQANYRSAQVYGLLLLAGVIGFAVNWAVTHVETLVGVRMHGN
ncbi:MAG TPA: ABC transporter permease subunit [Nocardioidaceae bacterium]|nr:ABC transporter permease subunit [Nocardioidaceae bacterium]